MNRISMTAVTIFASCVTYAGFTYGDTVLVLNDFEDGLSAGWKGAGPIVVATGGPTGDGDSFLQISSSGGFGSGSRAASFNDSADWIGDFSMRNATDIEFDMANFNESESALDMRVVLFGPDSNSNRWTSTDSQSVPNDGVWRRYSFSLAEADLARVQGTSAFDDAISDVVRVMFRHDLGTPSSSGTSVLATLGVDNISLLSRGGLSCDFDGDGKCDGLDIDPLMASVALGTNDDTFDLNGDGIVDNGDRDAWLAEAGPANGFTDSFLLGDSNLDGTANAQDLNALALAWQTDNTKWTSGNFTGSRTDAGDLNALALNWLQSVPSAAEAQAVPEPSSTFLALLAMCGLMRMRRS